MSRWRRFLTILASGITWNQMRGLSPRGSMMLSAPIPSSLSGSPMSRRQSSQVANPSGGGSSTYPKGSRPEAGKQLGVLAVDDELESGRHRAPIGSEVARALASMPRVKVG